jgi:hypothetical protein
MATKKTTTPAKKGAKLQNKPLSPVKTLLGPKHGW